MRKYLALLLLSLLPLGSRVLTADDDFSRSPWIGWRKGYEYYDRAGAFKEDQQWERALEFYRRSRDCFSAIRKNFPDWNKSVVEGRIKLCDNEISDLEKSVSRRPAASGHNIVSNSGRMPDVHAVETPEQFKRENRSIDPVLQRSTTVAGRSLPASAAVSGGSSGRLYIEMQSEIEQYRQRLRNALMEIDSLQLKLRQSEARAQDIDGLLHDYRVLQEKYSLLEMQYKNALDRAAGGDVQRLENQIAVLQQANDEALNSIKNHEHDLQQRDNEYALSRQEVLKLRDDLQKKINENRRLQRELELQRNRSASGAAASSESADRIKVLESELQRKDQRIERLMNLLSESTADGNVSASALGAELSKLQQEIDELHRQGTAEVSLRRQISELTASESSLKKSLSEVSTLLRQRETELESMKQSENKLNQTAIFSDQELQKNQERIRSLERELKAFADKYDELEKRHQDRLKADAVNTEKLVTEKREAEKKLIAEQNKSRNLAGDLEKMRRELDSAQTLVKSSRASVIELTAKQHSSEIELRKMAALQKAYDEQKARLDLFSQAADSDVLAALNRIPGLEESLKRYEKENRSLLDELDALKKHQRTQSGQDVSAETHTLQTAADPEKLEELLIEGRSAEARGNHELAIWSYRQVLGRMPDNEEAATRLGQIYLSDGKFAEAVKFLSPMVNKKPDDQTLLNKLVRAVIGNRDYPQALEMLNKFKQAHPGKMDADLLLTEAVIYSRSGRNAEAEKLFRQVLKMLPDNAEAAYELALMLSGDKKRLQEAGEFYMLAKSNGVAVDGYLEELLRSYSNTDYATRDFLLNSAREAMDNNDLTTANWYLQEAGKLYSRDREFIIAQAVYNLLSGKSTDVLGVLANPADGTEKFLLSAALLLSGKTEAAAGTIQGGLSELPAGVLPEALKTFLRKQEISSSGQTKTLYNLLLQKMP